jgi:hypothetical protein
VAFGVQGWRLVSAETTIERHADTALKLKDGKEVTASRYTSKMTVSLGTFEGETWCDGKGVVLRSITKMPFGTLEMVLEPEGAR